jgi:RND family efflux transporter MFP subunit
VTRHLLLATLLVAFPAWGAELAATLHWSQRVELGAAVSGIVQSVHVKPGDRVKKGQPLVSLDASGFEALVAEARAAVKEAEAEAEDAKRNLDRVQELYNRMVIAMSELEQAQLRHSRAQARLAAARARLAQAGKSLRDAVVRAPFDGVVLARQVEPGQAVASTLKAETLVVMARAGEMVARGAADLKQVEGLKPGQAVSVEAGGRRYPGHIRAVALEPSGAKAGYEVEAVFSVSETLRAGAPAVIHLP